MKLLARQDLLLIHQFFKMHIFHVYLMYIIIIVMLENKTPVTWMLHPKDDLKSIVLQNPQTY